MNAIGQKRIWAWRACLPLAITAMLLPACSKEGGDPPCKDNGQTVTDTGVKERLVEMTGKLPAVGIYNRTMDRILVFRAKDDGSRDFTFSTLPSDGINFATSNGGQWVWTEEGGLVVITDPEDGIGGGGGSVGAGNTNLDIDFAVCFAFDEDAIGADLFSTGIEQVAGVIGIAGDFEALQNGDFEEGDDLFQYFHGFAYYLVYTEQLADQSYDVLNWVDDLDEDEEDLQNFAFAFVVNFQDDGGIYISKDGTLTVNGGSMDFNGHYYAIEGVGFFDDEDDDATFSEVSGYGMMGCSQ